MAQIVPVVSESLEAQVRNLLPSQAGFGEDLQASNVIVPILDLTPAALQTQTPQYLQTALSFGSNTPFQVNNTSSVIVNTAGFWRITAVSFIEHTSGKRENILQMSDGISTKNVWQHVVPTSASPTGDSTVTIDLTFYLRSGESITASTDNAAGYFTGSTRQVADVNGNLVYPLGYSPQ